MEVLKYLSELFILDFSNQLDCLLLSTLNFVMEHPLRPGLYSAPELILGVSRLRGSLGVQNTTYQAYYRNESVGGPRK